MVRRVMCLLIVIMLGVSVFAGVLTHANSGGADPPAWASPKDMAVKLVSPVGSAQNESNFLNNLDCSLTDYRVPGSNTMQTGCFTNTAFGAFDSDSGIVIFNGTDEGLPVLPYAVNQILEPWPLSGSLLSLETAPIDGSYINLYKFPLSDLQDHRNFLGVLTAKQLTTAPDIHLNDPSGKPLIINAQTLAFSDGGSWMVAESLGGSFVRVNLATLEMIPFAPSFGASGSPGLLKSQVALSPDGHYIAINNEAAGSLKVYDLTDCAGTIDGLKPLDCKSYDYRSFISGQIRGLRSIHHMRFVNNGLLSFEVTASSAANDGIYELAPASSITSLTDYLGLGDSYTSGEGAFDYLTGSDTTDDMCHLSANSYPILLTNDLFGHAGGHSVACSGAEINDVGSTSDGYKGQVKGVLSWQHLEQGDPALLASVMANFAPGYVAQQRFVRQYQPGLATVSIGGDDIGFGDMVQDCVQPHISRHPIDDTCFNTYEGRLELQKLIDRTIPRWISLYKELLAEAPGMRLFAIGYPQIVADTGTCALNVHLSKSELEFTEETIDYLNGDIRQAASKVGIPYVDIGQALAGHRLCETASYNVAVNGLTAGKDGGILGVKVFGKESYHPNALGQQLIEQFILKQTHNFAETPAAKADPPDSTKLLNAPKTGRAVSTRIPDPNLTSRAAKAGKSVAIKTTGSRDGLKPNTSYVVHLDGPGGPAIGTVASNSLGDIDGAVDIPTNTSASGHTIDITGTNQAGEPVDVTQPIYITVSDDDSDGDGVPNASDSCPFAANSGIDSDSDNIDDACDPLIGQTTTHGTTNSSSTSNPANIASSNNTSGLNSSSDSVNSIAPSSPATISLTSDGVVGSIDQSSEDIGQSLFDQSDQDIVVADFTVDNSPAFKGHDVTGVLGAATLNPTRLTANRLLTPSPKKSFQTSKKFPDLRKINWPPWLIMPVIAWLLVVLIFYCLDRFTENKYQNSRVSTTIN